ncbi:MAG: single-stranded DNA-binding protein [Candidatus Diapherotrites archaeon]|nr:single-stranded DNA-binding protein [Candidatus Diapherotrites archaeon]
MTMKVSEIRPYGKKIDLTVKALKKNEEREVSSKLDGSTHKVTEALVGDETGTVLLTLWDDTIAKVEEGKSYKVTNAYASFFKNSLRVNIGRFGTIEESPETVENANEKNNLSEKEFSGRQA